MVDGVLRPLWKLPDTVLLPKLLEEPCTCNSSSGYAKGTPGAKKAVSCCVQATGRSKSSCPCYTQGRRCTALCSCVECHNASGARPAPGGGAGDRADEHDVVPGDDGAEQTEYETEANAIAGHDDVDHYSDDDDAKRQNLIVLTRTWKTALATPQGRARALNPCGDTDPTTITTTNTTTTTTATTTTTKETMTMTMKMTMKETMTETPASVCSCGARPSSPRPALSLSVFVFQHKGLSLSYLLLYLL